jgi:hypothetical protein
VQKMKDFNIDEETLELYEIGALALDESMNG